MGRAAAVLAAALIAMLARPALAAGYANPGAVIAAEAQFQRLAQEVGLWTAALEMAAPGAKLFEPQPVLAETALKGRGNPATAPGWQSHEVWSSCDGSFAVTRGAWRDGGEAARFVTLWQRQEDGAYRWVLRLHRPVLSDMPAPEMIMARVAQCERPKEGAVRPPPPQAAKRRKKAAKEAAVALFDPLEGRSADGTLQWRSGTDALGVPYFDFALKADGSMPQLVPAL